MPRTLRRSCPCPARIDFICTLDPASLPVNIQAHIEKRAPDPASLLVPGIADGVAGMRFIEGALECAAAQRRLDPAHLIRATAAKLIFLRSQRPQPVSIGYDGWVGCE